MRDRQVEGRTVGQSALGPSRSGALSGAIAALAEAEQFVLISLRPGDPDPEITGFGGVDPAMVDGLKVAHDYLTEELRETCLASDVTKLVALLCDR